MDKQEIKGGAFQIARKIFQSELWLYKPSSWKVVWVYILGKVSHKNHKDCERGEGFFQWTKELSLIGGDMTLDIVKKSTFFFRKNEMISTRRSTRGVFIKVLNYNTYQTIDNYSKHHTKHQRSTREALEKHQRSTTIDKNGKNVKNEQEERESTPSRNAKTFFKGVKDLIEKIESVEAEDTKAFLRTLEQKYPNAQKGLIWSEIKKFYLYWTELNGTGTKERWEKQDAFQVDRRLVTWFGKVEQFKRLEINNKETKVGKL